MPLHLCFKDGEFRRALSAEVVMIQMRWRRYSTGLQIRRQKHLGSHFFDKLADIAVIKFSHLLDFIRSSKWFTGAYNQQHKRVQDNNVHFLRHSGRKTLKNSKMSHFCTVKKTPYDNNGQHWNVPILKRQIFDFVWRNHSFKP